MLSKILFLTEVHGDEKIGSLVLDEIKDYLPKNVEIILANKKASERNIRFVDCDLNRCAPGKKDSSKYEERRAYEIIEMSKKFDIAIDIHGSISKTGIFTLITNLTKENLLLASSLPIDNIVIWEGSKDSKTGPLTEYMARAIEIECGPKDSEAVRSELKKIILKIIEDGLDVANAKIKGKNIFTVGEKIYSDEGEKGQLKNLRDFEPFNYNGRDIIPIFVNQYPGVLCYLLTREKDPDTFLSSIVP